MTKRHFWLYIQDLFLTTVTATGRSARWISYWGRLWKQEQWWALVSRWWWNHSTFEISGCALWALLTQSTNTLKLLSPSHIPPVSGFEPGTFGVRSRHSTNVLLSSYENCCSETGPVQNWRPDSIFCCGNLVNTLELNKPKNPIVTPNSKFLIKLNSCVKSIKKVVLEMYPQNFEKNVG